MDLSLLVPPLAGAVIGWVTNYVAIKLLFRPHKPFNMLGWKLQGVIPKRRKEIARSMAKAIEKDLFSSEDLSKALSGIDWKKEIHETVAEAVEHRFNESKWTKLPVVGLVSENLKNRLKLRLATEITTHLDRKKGAIASKVKGHIDIHGMIVSKIDKLDLMRFEKLLTEFIARELKHLEWLGGVMGLVIGIFQSAFIYFIG